jgi:hypothetical protein
MGDSGSEPHLLTETFWFCAAVSDDVRSAAAQSLLCELMLREALRTSTQVLQEVRGNAGNQGTVDSLILVAARRSSAKRSIRRTCSTGRSGSAGSQSFSIGEVALHVAKSQGWSVARISL